MVQSRYKVISVLYVQYGDAHLRGVFSSESQKSFALLLESRFAARQTLERCCISATAMAPANGHLERALCSHRLGALRLHQVRLAAIDGSGWPPSHTHRATQLLVCCSQKMHAITTRAQLGCSAGVAGAWRVTARRCFSFASERADAVDTQSTSPARDSGGAQRLGWAGRCRNLCEGLCWNE